MHKKGTKRKFKTRKILHIKNKKNLQEKKMSTYYSQKEALKEKAERHVKTIERNFKNETAECVQNTKIYGGDGATVTKTPKGKNEKVKIIQILHL